MVVFACRSLAQQSWAHEDIDFSEDGLRFGLLLLCWAIFVLSCLFDDVWLGLMLV